MLHFLPAFVLGPLTFTLIVLNVLLWAIPVYILLIPRLLIRTPSVRRSIYEILTKLGEGWIACNGAILALTQATQWEIDLPELAPERRYLVTSNHQSWIDVLVLQKAFNRKIPFLKFFVKKELVWVPVLGLIWWGMEFPFMKRYSKEFLEQHPELRGEDLKTTRQLCERFAGMPVSIMNFLEGTRFTEAKHARQNSPYRNLLKPKAGGFAFVLDAMGDQLDSILDVTVIYDCEGHSLWDLVCGRVRRVTVKAREVAIQDFMLGGNYAEDEGHRDRMQAFVRDLWEQKDAFIETVKPAPIREAA